MPDLGNASEVLQRASAVCDSIRQAQGWPAGSLAGDVRDGINRLMRELRSDPTHPEHQNWIEENRKSMDPTSWHR